VLERYVVNVLCIVVPYELYELYEWGKVPELYGTLRILRFHTNLRVDRIPSAVTSRIHCNGPPTMLKLKRLIRSLTLFQTRCSFGSE